MKKSGYEFMFQGVNSLLYEAMFHRDEERSPGVEDRDIELLIDSLFETRKVIESVIERKLGGEK